MLHRRANTEMLERYSVKIIYGSVDSTQVKLIDHKYCLETVECGIHTKGTGSRYLIQEKCLLLFPLFAFGNAFPFNFQETPMKWCLVSFKSPLKTSAL